MFGLRFCVLMLREPMRLLTVRFPHFRGSGYDSGIGLQYALETATKWNHREIWYNHPARHPLHSVSGPNTRHAELSRNLDNHQSAFRPRLAHAECVRHKKNMPNSKSWHRFFIIITNPQAIQSRSPTFCGDPARSSKPKAWRTSPGPRLATLPLLEQKAGLRGKARVERLHAAHNTGKSVDLGSSVRL